MDNTQNEQTIEQTPSMSESLSRIADSNERIADALEAIAQAVTTSTGNRFIPPHKRRKTATSDSNEATK